MELIDYVISHIRNRIPYDLLNMAFKQHSLYQRHNTTSLEWLIKSEVIDQFVLPDLNTIGGQHTNIDLSGLTPTVAEGAYIYRIPTSMTQGREISRVMAIEYGARRNNFDTGSDPLTNAANAMLASSTPFESAGISNVRLVGPNTVLVHETLGGIAWLKCVLSYDEQFSTVDKAYWRDFANLCVMATEAIVYNRVSIQIGSGSSTGGTPNDRLLSRLDQMEDAYVRYQEFIEDTFHRIAIFSDPEASREHIGIMLGGIY